MKKQSYPILYTLWAAMFLLTAALGLLFPEESGPGRWVLMAISLIFFVPPWMILHRARAAEDLSQIRLVRYLSLASVVLTAVLLVLNLKSAGLSDAMGRALNAALAVVSAPMLCSQFFVLPIFLWGCLIADTFRKK